MIKAYCSLLLLMIRSFFCMVLKKQRKIPLQRKNTDKTMPLPAENRYREIGTQHFSNDRQADEAIVLLTGDIICQRIQQEKYKQPDGSFDFSDSFAAVRNLFSQADLVIGNFENTVDDTFPYMHEMRMAEGVPFLNAPSEWVAAVAQSGFDGVVRANNHLCDCGLHGITTTDEVLNRCHVPFTGALRKKDNHLIYDVNGFRVAILSYASFYNFKSCYLSYEDRERLPVFEKKQFQTDYANVRDAGAEYVIVYMHWGIEYTKHPTVLQKRTAKLLVKAGVDCIAGAHPHILQPLVIINGIPCHYSMGNFISSQTKEGTQDSEILSLHLKRDGKRIKADAAVIPVKTEDFCVIPK